jgi:cobalt-zinc-cadmium efflux system membrane fusion protein
MKKALFASSLLFAVALFVSGCGETTTPPSAEPGAAAADFERGPHNGRLLRDGDFALEVTIFEEGVPPEFHMYPYRDGEPVDPREVQLSVTLSRLGGAMDRFAFQPVQDYLRGLGVVTEPHSFDVAISAVHAGMRHDWQYASYEGRTTIAAEAAEQAGVKVETAGPAEIEEVIDIAGRVEVVPQARTEVRAWYPGRIMAMTKALGDTVRRGETIARVESSSSLQTYNIPAPQNGVIVERNANVGDTSEDRALYVIADLTQLHAELFVYPRDAERVRPGQKVEIRSLTGDKQAILSIEKVLPTANPESQTLVAHVELPADREWRPGMAVEGRVTIGTYRVPLAVRTPALQRFRDFTVVYARYGDTYEVRMLELGRQTPEWTEILGGLEPGTPYVTDNAFLIRADVEKTGATHDH